MGGYQNRVIPAQAGTPVVSLAIANGGSRLRGNDAVGGLAKCIRSVIMEQAS